MEIPKGTLIPVGGNENKGNKDNPKDAVFYEAQFQKGILRRIVNEIGGPASKLEVVTTASRIPYEVGEMYEKAFNKIGCKHIDFMHIRRREEATDKEYIKRLKKCDGIMFSGGDQMRIAAVFGGTEFHDILCDRYKNEEFVIAGTSAGAMAMCNTMIYRGKSSEGLLKEEVKIATGLSLIQNVIIDTHFIHRGRFARLSQAVAANPSCIGIGLGEDTGLVIKRGNDVETIGTGLVIAIDGHEIKHSNLEMIGEKTPLSIQHLIVHVLAQGDHYFIRDRSMKPFLTQEQILLNEMVNGNGMDNKKNVNRKKVEQAQEKQLNTNNGQPNELKKKPGAKRKK